LVERVGYLLKMMSLNVNVDGSRTDVLVTKKLLQRENVNATFKQMCGEAVPQRVDRSGLVDAGFFFASLKAR
jgi:hypothetical protein